MKRRTLIPMAALLSLVVAACGGAGTTAPPTTDGPNGGSSTTDPDPPPDGPSPDVPSPDVEVLEAVRANLEPRVYVDEYEETTPPCSARSGGGSGAPTGQSPTMVDAAEDESVGAPAPPPPPEPPTITEDNTFTNVGDTGFVPTATDPLSTFGLDIDTGSYRIAEHFVERGYQPPRDSIRTEEWINAFDYGYTPPTDVDLGVTTMSGVVPYTSDGTRLVGIGVDSRRIADEDRPAANVTFVVDGSGSMNIRDRLGLVKSSLALLVMNLRPDDSIAIVEFGNEAYDVLEHTPLTEADRIIAALDELSPCGGTNMDAGIERGYEVAREAFDEDRLNVVVLAGDGVGNIGLTEPEDIIENITEQGRDGINMVSLGFGMGNFNDTMLEQLANQGNGFYAYINTFEDAERLFVDQLTPTLTTIVGDARIQVSFDPEVVESYRLIGYENRALDDDDFRNDDVDAGELGAGHTATALYEVRLHPVDGGADVGADGEPAEVGSVALRWESLDTGEMVEIAETLTVGPLDADNEPDLALAATVAYSAELMRGNSAVTGRQVSFDDLIADARILADAGQDGAGDLADLLAAARDLPEADG